MEHVRFDDQLEPSVAGMFLHQFSANILAPSLYHSTILHQMGAEVSQAVRSDLENSTLKGLLSDERVSLSQ